MNQPQAAARRLLILGSCVSRDILAAPGSGRVALADYFARSSIASLAASPVAVPGAQLARISSAFQRRSVERDAGKDFLRSALLKPDFDAILLDLVDERFDLYQPAPGALLTVTGELLASGFVTNAERGGANWIANGSERYRGLWRDGVERLFATLRDLGLARRVIVNRVSWADRMEDGTPLDGPQREAAHKANALLEWMYRELERHVAPEQWMTFSDAVLRAGAAHRWGPAPFHYADAYYSAARAQLAAIADARCAGARLACDGDVLAASAEPAPGAASKFAFQVYKDRELLHATAYGDTPALRFDTGGRAGAYEVVGMVLSLAPGRAPARHTFALRCTR